MKKALSIVLVITLLFCGVTPALAAVPDPVDPLYEHILSPEAGLSISSGTATCSGYMETFTNYQCRLTIRLQYLDGTTWRTLEEQVFEDYDYVRGSFTYPVDTGYTYRTLAICALYDDHDYLVQMKTKTQQVTY